MALGCAGPQRMQPPGCTRRTQTSRCSGWGTESHPRMMLRQRALPSLARRRGSKLLKHRLLKSQVQGQRDDYEEVYRPPKLGALAGAVPLQDGDPNSHRGGVRALLHAFSVAIQTRARHAVIASESQAASDVCFDRAKHARDDHIACSSRSECAPISCVTRFAHRSVESRVPYRLLFQRGRRWGGQNCKRL